MDRLPDDVRARLEKNQVDVRALEEILNRLPPENRAHLREVISSETPHLWGVSAEAGTPESLLIDKAFARVEGYQRINGQED